MIGAWQIIVAPGMDVRDRELQTINCEYLADRMIMYAFQTRPFLLQPTTAHPPNRKCLCPAYYCVDQTRICVPDINHGHP